MRTTLDINDALLIEAKREAARSNQTLTAFVENALRRQLNAKQSDATDIPKLPVFGGGGVQPGVDLTNNAALLDVMEKADGKYGR
jgi:hypothetical protein